MPRTICGLPPSATARRSASVTRCPAAVGAAGPGCSLTPWRRRTTSRSATSPSPVPSRAPCWPISSTDGLAHRPTHASLIVGVNDTMRSTWDPPRMRTELMTCAEALHGGGRRAGHREVPRPRGGVRAAGGPAPAAVGADRGGEPDLRRDPRDVRRDPVRPGDLSRDPRARVLVGRPAASLRARPPRPGRAYAALLHQSGLDFPLPCREPSGGFPPSWRRDLAWMVAEGAPWIGRRARDLGPWAARMAVSEARGVVRPASRRQAEPTR